MSTIFLTLLILCTLYIYTSSATYKNFTADKNIIFNHLAVHTNGESIYIAAATRLYHLSEDLSLLNSQSTEPACPSAKCNSSQTPNVNKVLAIDYQNSRLILCSNTNKGSCTAYDTINITRSYLIQTTESIVGTDNTSTIAFIAPGPMISNALYVAASQPSDLPDAISSHSLNKKVDAADKIARISVKNKTIPIEYVYGFVFGSFSYFLSNEMNKSKIARICQKDKDYETYIEAPIICEGGGVVQAATTNSDRLIVAFTGNKSVLCEYSLSQINVNLNKEIENCLKDTSKSKGMSAIVKPSSQCRPPNSKNAINTCLTNQTAPLSIVMPIRGNHVYTSDKALTALVATSNSNQNIVLAGTSSGHLKMMYVRNALWKEYADLQIDEGSPVNADLLLDPKNARLYVMTKNKVTKVRIHECDQFKSCENCLTAKDPYCGWCMVDKKCSLRNECGNGETNSLLWTSSEANICPAIVDVTPKKISSADDWILVSLNHNLSLHDKFICEFRFTGSVTLTANSTSNNSTIFCDVSKLENLTITGEPTSNVNLFLNTGAGQTLLETKMEFLNCGIYEACGECVSQTQIPCKWCVGKSRCVHDSHRNCTTSNVCNLITGTASGSNEILVPSSIQKNIEVNVLLENPLSRVFCSFYLEANKTCDLEKEGSFDENNKISCKATQFDCWDPNPALNVSLKIILDNGIELYNPEKVHMVVYNCNNLAVDCGKCLDLDKKYRCGWCQISDRCEVESDCQSHWSNNTKTCSDPYIRSFEPVFGPLGGRTQITINGSNLDKTKRITVGSIPCEVSKLQTQTVVCQLSQSVPNDIVSGPISVKSANTNITSNQPYTFVDPQILTISPIKGPYSGGTLLSLNVTHINAYQQIQVLIDDLPCKLEAQKQNLLKCKTSPSRNAIKGRVTVLIDGAIRTFNGSLFQYTEDPTITKVGSDASDPKSIPIGGTQINVTGTNFLSVKEPLLRVYNKEERAAYVGTCDPKSDDLMVCISPNIPIRNTTIDSDKPKRLDYGFEMDGVVAVQNLSSQNYGYFHLYPNPSFHNFSNGIKYYECEILTITGENLNLGCQRTDIEVQVGNGNCHVYELNKKLLKCYLPEILSKNGNTTEMDVVVRIGQHFTQNVGKLSFLCSSGLKQTKTAIMIFFYCVIIGSILLVAKLIHYVYKWRMSVRRRREIHRRLQEKLMAKQKHTRV